MKPEIERQNVHSCALYILDSIVDNVEPAAWHLACMRQFNEMGKVSYTYDLIDTNQAILDWFTSLDESPPDVNGEEFALFCEKVFTTVHAFMCAPGFRL